MSVTDGVEEQAARLIECEPQRETIAAMLEALGQGRGSTVMVEGPAGIGKTAVLKLALALAPSLGVRSLQAMGGANRRL